MFRVRVVVTAHDPLTLTRCSSALAYQQKASIRKASAHLLDILKSHATLINKTAYGSWDEFFECFLRVGGVLVPFRRDERTVQVDAIVDPTGTPQILCCSEKFYSKPFQNAVSLLQASVPAALASLTTDVLAALVHRGVRGHVCLELAAPRDAPPLVKDLSLEYSSTLAMSRAALFRLPGRSLGGRSAVVCDSLYHVNLGLVRHAVLLKMCRARSIVFDASSGAGVFLLLLHPTQRSVLSMVAVAEAPQSVLRLFAEALVTIHKDISSPGVEAHNLLDISTFSLKVAEDIAGEGRAVT
jgi:hypothetical protein